MKNCPNCSAPLEPYKCKCDYCGTYYYDLTALDVSGRKPTYVKFKTRDKTGRECVLTALAMPVFEYMESHDDVDTFFDLTGMPHQILHRRCATVSMRFELMETAGKLYTMEVKNEQ